MTIDPDKFFNLADATENVVQQILAYESDTFSATDASLGRPTAERMAAWLIRTQLFDEDGIPGPRIDGAVLEQGLYNVTEAIASEHDAQVADQEAIDAGWVPAGSEDIDWAYGTTQY